MGWLSTLFSAPSASTRRGQALRHTDDAFTLPPPSPSFAPAPRADPFSPHLSDSDPQSAFSYPPPSSARGSFDYAPSPTTARGRQGPLLPLHQSPQAGHGGPGPQPPLAQTWARLRAWLAREYPELGDTINYGMPPADMAAIELQLGGLELPAAVRDSYLCADGQEPESAAACAAGLFFGLTLLPLEDVLEEWRFWREVDDDPQTGANPRLRAAMRSVPPGFVRREYSARGWLPLAADKAGNYLGVDLNPDERGASGQVIVFGRDVDTKVVLWRGDGPDGWARWLAAFADELEAGEGFEIRGTRADVSDEDEDEIGYASYFYDGTGHGHGDTGGDAGAGGFRLVGEYQNWEVLHAWADRSIRRWQDAGVLTDAPVSDKLPEKVGLGVIDLEDEQSAAPAPDAGAPDTLAPASAAGAHGRKPSAVRAPAPMPVMLPTEQDIFPTDGDEYSPVADDAETEAEAGRSTFSGGPSPQAPAHPLAHLLGDAPVRARSPTSPAGAAHPPPLIPAIEIEDSDAPPPIVDEDEHEDSDEDEDESESDVPAVPAAAPAPAPAAPAVSTGPSSPTTSDGFETVDVPGAEEARRTAAPEPAQNLA